MGAPTPLDLHPGAGVKAGTVAVPLRMGARILRDPRRHGEVNPEAVAALLRTCVRSAPNPHPRSGVRP